MNCHIPIKAQEALSTQVISELLDLNAAGEKLDLKNYMRSIQKQITEVTDDELTGLDAARLVPLFISHTISFEAPVRELLERSGISLETIFNEADKYTNDETGLEAARTDLGTEIDVERVEVEEMAALSEETVSEEPLFGEGDLVLLGDEAHSVMSAEEDLVVLDDGQTVFTKDLSLQKKAPEVTVEEIFENIPEKTELIVNKIKKAETLTPEEQDFYTEHAQNIEKILKEDAPKQPTEKVHSMANLSSNEVNKHITFWGAGAASIMATLAKEGFYVPTWANEEQKAKYAHKDLRMTFKDQKGAYGLLRQVLEQLLYNTSVKDNTEVVIGDVHGVYITAKTVDGQLKQAITDKEGNTLTVNPDTLELDPNGQPAEFGFHDITGLVKADGTIDQSEISKSEHKGKIKAKAKSLGNISYAKAKVLYEDEVQLLHNVQEHLRKDSANTVQFNITGGSFGYVEIAQFNPTPLSKISPEQDITFGQKTENNRSVTYINAPELYGQDIELERPGVNDTTYVDTIADLFTEPLTHAKEGGLTFKKREELLSLFINTADKDLMMKIEEVPEADGEFRLMLEGKFIPLSTAVERESAKVEIRRLFETVVEMTGKDFTSQELAESNVKMVASITDASAGDFVLKGNNKYVKTAYKRKMHISKKNLTTDEVDVPVITTVGNAKMISYDVTEYRTFLGDSKFVVNTPDLGKDNFIRRFQGYLTWELSEAGTKTLESDVTEEVPEVKDLKDEGDSALDHTSDDDYGSDIDDDYAVIAKRHYQKDKNIKVTPAQLEAAEKWYSTHPMSKELPFKVWFEKVNTKAVATFAVDGITLYEGADYTDLYHEAWHGFTQLFLDKAQKKEVYDEVRKKKGSFVDFSGKHLRFATASDLQVEEYLAEGFRTYMLTGKKAITGSPKVSGFFRKVWNVLKALYGKATGRDIILDPKSDSVIGELFSKLELGNFKEFSYSTDNVQFVKLSSGITVTEETGEKSQLNYQDSMLLVDMVDGYIAERLDVLNAKHSKENLERKKNLQEKYNNANRLGLSKGEIKAIVKELESLESISKRFTGRITKNQKLLSSAYFYAKGELEKLKLSILDQRDEEQDATAKSELDKQLKTISFAIENFGNHTVEGLSSNTAGDPTIINNVIGYHMAKTKVFVDIETQEQKLIELNYENEDGIYVKKAQQFDRSGDESSLKEMAKAEIVYLIRTLPTAERDAHGDPKKNKFGIVELTDFQTTWNKISRVLEQSMDPAEMYERLKKESVEYPPLKVLLERMGQPAEEDVLQGTSLWTNFWQTFNKPRVPHDQLTFVRTVGKGGIVTFENTMGEAFNADYVVGKNWQSSLSSGSTADLNYRSRDGGGYYLNLDAIINGAKGTKGFPSEADAVADPIGFYNAIGFTMSEVPGITKAMFNEHNKVEDLYNPRFFWKRVQNLHSKDAKVYDLSDIYEDETKMYKDLQVLEAKHSDMFSSFKVTTADGNSKYEHTLNNTMTVKLHLLNNAPTYDALIANPHMEHLDVEKYPQAKSSLLLKSLFKLKFGSNGKKLSGWGERRKTGRGEVIKVRLSNLAGILLKDKANVKGDGVSNMATDEFAKLIGDVHASYEGKTENMRHENKSFSPSISMSGQLLGKTDASQLYIPFDNFAGRSGGPVGYNQLVAAQLLPHVIAELERVRSLKVLARDGVSNYDIKYVKEGQEILAFHSVFSPAVKEELQALIDKNLDSEFVEETIESDLYDRMKEDMRVYFQDQVLKAKIKFDQAPFVSGNLRQKVENIIKARDTKVSVEDMLIRSYVHNNWIHNIETMALFYGDIAQYKHANQDFHKRNAGAGSTGSLFRTDQMMNDQIDQLWDSSYAAKYADELGITRRRTTGQASTAIVEDHNVASVYYEDFKALLGEKEAAPYGDANNPNGKRMTEADAQGLITFDFYRELKVREGSWDFQVHDKLFQAIKRGEAVDPKAVAKFFPVMKAQYWGPLANEGMPLTGFHKYSLFPMIPSVMKGKKMNALHNKMVKENIGYLTFESGSKMAIVTKSGDVNSGKRQLDQLFDDNKAMLPGIMNTDGEANVNVTDDAGNYVPHFTPNLIHLEYLKNQLEISDELKNKIIFPTQLRKLVEEGSMDQGGAVDFMVGKPDDKRRAAWDKLTETEKVKASPRYAMIHTYEKNLNKLTQWHKTKLLKQIGWTSTIVNGKEQLDGDLENLLTLVRSELERQDLSDHAIDFFNISKETGEFTDVSLSYNVEQIEKMLTALMTKKLIKQKVNGEGLVQVASTMLDDFFSEQGRDFKNPTEEDKLKYGTRDLPFYIAKKGEGTLAMKVKVSLSADFLHLLNAQHIDGESIKTIERLNEMLKNEDWLKSGDNRQMITMTAVRIPVQGFNSMEFMEVYEFLEPAAGGIIVLPTEIVAKSGADYDVDKLNVMMPGISTINNKAELYKNTKVTDTPENLGVKNKELRAEIKQAREDGATGEEIDALKEAQAVIQRQLNMSSSKVIENDIITNLIDILSHSDNAKALLTPNSTHLLTEGYVDEDGKDVKVSISKELSKVASDHDPMFIKHEEDLKAGDKSKTMSPSKIFEPIYNLFKHTTNRIASDTLAVGAIDNTYNTLLTRAGAHMNLSNIIGVDSKVYKELLAKKESKGGRLSKKEESIVRRYVPQNIMLRHNTMKTADNKQVISLSHLTDASGDQSISEVINQLINGWVDAAKDPWIFNIQGNMEVTPVLLFMIQAGVPFREAIYFASNPLIREYVKQQRLSKSSLAVPLGKSAMDEDGNPAPYFYKKHARNAVVMNPENGFNIENAYDIEKAVTANALSGKSFDIKTLQSKAHGSLENVNDTDRAIFLHFLQLDDMAKSVSDLKKATNVDTSRDNSLFEAQDRKVLLEKIRKDGRMPEHVLDNVMKNSPISSFFMQDFQINLLGGLFPLRNHETINNYAQDISDTDIKNTYGKKDLFVTKWKSGIVSYVFQNELRHFNLDDAKFYKSRDVKEVTHATEDIVLKGAGAAVKDGKMYIDKNTLTKQFSNGVYHTDEYEKSGLAKLSNEAFAKTNVGQQQYFDFVLARESLRDSRPLKSLADSKQYQHHVADVRSRIVKDIDETVEEFGKRIMSKAYEEYLRDVALTKTFNHWHTFHSDNGYAKNFVRIFDDKDYAGLKNFKVMTALRLDADSKSGFFNLAPNSKDLTGDDYNIFKENLDDLTSYAKVQDALPDASKQDIDEIIEYFTAFPIVSFLQSGMNAHSDFALINFTSSEARLKLLKQPMTKLKEILDKGGELSEKYLKDYTSQFVRENGNRTSRVKGTNMSRGINLTDTATIKEGVKDVERFYGENDVVEEDVSEPKLEGNTYVNPKGHKSAKSLLDAYPGKVFVYEYARVKQNSPRNYTPQIFSGNGTNVMPITTHETYSEHIEDSMNQIDETVKKAIDENIAEMLKNKDSLMFSKSGYGQAMRNDPKSIQTFLYLSKALLDNFEYENPGYKDKRSDTADFQNQQAISDAEIAANKETAIEEFFEVNETDLTEFITKCKNG